MNAESHALASSVRNDWSWRIATADLASALARLGEEESLSLPLLRPKDAAALIAEATKLEWRPAKPVVGADDRRVWQDFKLTMTFPADSLYRDFAAALEHLLHAALNLMTDPPMPKVPLNDMILQDYPAGSQGITPHKDHIAYRYLVAIVVLRGAGRFFICEDRAGRAAREIPAPAGCLLLMRAPGFAGREDRPFHMLGDVSADRLAFGLRYDSRAQ
jgi:hypothetical protein